MKMKELQKLASVSSWPDVLEVNDLIVKMHEQTLQELAKPDHEIDKSGWAWEHGS